jgi:hypothetical protein
MPGSRRNVEHKRRDNFYGQHPRRLSVPVKEIFPARAVWPCRAPPCGKADPLLRHIRKHRIFKNPVLSIMARLFLNALPIDRRVQYRPAI